MASPHLIELDEAVSRIKQACDGRTPNQPSPYFFMVGAGISVPSVPQASEITSSCKEKAAEFGRLEEPESREPMDLYSHWFDRAYAEPRLRQQFLRELIERKQITHANFRLAHLLLDDRISNIVFTTNFDDYLTKALTLFGKRHIVCDHPQMVGRIDHTQSDLQIVHLHGTYWFYDCCNLRGELQDRAPLSQETTATMASLLDTILWNRSPLILGYSGWEGDVFMSALKRRLKGRFGSNAYWFCFQRNQVKSLPDWLKHDPHLRFVVPAEPPARKHGDSKQIDETSSVSSKISKTFSAAENGGPFLPADRVLDKLIRGFSLEAPALTKDPLGFFAAQLDESLPKDEASDADIYGVKNVIERVIKAKLRDLADQSEPDWVWLEGVRDALRRADYRAAISLATQVQLTGLRLEALQELSEAAWVAATNLNDDSEEEIVAYDLVGTTIDRMTVIAEPWELPLIKVERAGEALFNKSVSLWTLNRSEEALAVVKEMVGRYAGAVEVDLRDPLALALFTQAVNLGALRRSEEAIATYEDVVRRFGDAPELGLQETVADALNGLGFELIIAAKALFLRGDELAAKETLEKARLNISSSLEKKPDAPITLGNAAYVAFLLERVDEARALLTRAIELGGEKIRDAELGDATINRLAKDDEFIELVRSIPRVD